jgi:hypothetical protein
MRTIAVAFGNWAENRNLPRVASLFSGMVRYKENKAPVSMFTPENIASLPAKDRSHPKAVHCYSAFAGLRMTELRRLDWERSRPCRSTFQVFRSPGTHGNHNRGKTGWLYQMAARGC